MNRQENSPLIVCSSLESSLTQSSNGGPMRRGYPSEQTSTGVGISRLRHLRPKQMRRLYQTCVVPKHDYASTVWYRQGKIWQTSKLRRIQRTAAIKTASASRTVSTDKLEIEASLLPTHLRLKQRALNVLGELKTLPIHHPIWPLVHPVGAAPARNTTRSPLMLTIATAAETSGSRILRALASPSATFR